MTLNEFIESVSKLKGWKSFTGVGGLGFEVPQAAGRKQFVAVSEFRDESQPMVRFSTQIGPADRLDSKRLRSALELNAHLPHGCLAVDAGHLVMTNTRPLKTTTPETSGKVIEFIARQADQYEKLIFQTDVH